jgi:hypothetical protein
MISTLHFLKSFAGTHRPSWGPSSGNWKHSLHEGEASFPCKEQASAISIKGEILELNPNFKLRADTVTVVVSVNVQKMA